MLKIEDISYGDVEDGQGILRYTHWQPIIDHKHGHAVIGCLIMVEKNYPLNLIDPIEERYQFGAFKKDIPDDIVEIEESEDEKWVFVKASSLEEFVILRNRVYLPS